MPGPYDIYPAVDLNYAFPPEVRSAAAASAELKLVMDTNVSAAVAAAKVSPAFTGFPTVPDVGGGDASTRISNTNFVSTAVSNAKVSPAFTGTPSTPDITDTGANDGRLANTKFVQLITSANKVSPAFSGSATSSTPGRDENNTRIATMASVRSAMQLFGLGGEAQQGYYGTDWNSYLTTGFFKGSDYSNGPGSGWFFVTVTRHDDGYVLQDAVGYTNLAYRHFTRLKLGGNWNTWREVHQAQGDFTGNNWNDLRNPGTYRGNNTSGSPNGPGGYGWGMLLVGNSGNGQLQMWFPDQANMGIATRASWTGDSWQPWRRIHTSPDDFPLTLTNNASGSIIGTRVGRHANLSFNLTVNSGFGVNGIGTIAFVPDGHRPATQNAELPLRTSDGYTCWMSIGTNGYMDWRPGGTGGGGASPGTTLYGTVTYLAQY